MMVKFWLDTDKPEQLKLYTEIKSLMESRLFAPTLRDALILYLSLKTGDTSVLFELFPLLRAHLNGARPIPPDVSPVETPSLEQHTADTSTSFLDQMRSL